MSSLCGKSLAYKQEKVISIFVRPRIIIIDWAILSSQNITSKGKGLMGHVWFPRPPQRPYILHRYIYTMINICRTFWGLAHQVCLSFPRPWFDAKIFIGPKHFSLGLMNYVWALKPPQSPIKGIFACEKDIVPLLWILVNHGYFL